MAGNTATPRQSVTSRALAILGTFDAGHRAQRLADVSRRAELSLTTTHRLLGELTAWGAVTHLDNGTYVIGSRLWELGLLAPTQADLKEVAAPFLADIHAATHATVHLAVRDGRQALYVDCTSGHASVPVVSTVGSRLPLHATGVGKVLLAYAPSEVVDGALNDLRRVTRYTVTQKGRLTRQLEKVRVDGYATTAEEMSLGACSVAAPVVDVAGRVRAAIGIVAQRIDRDLEKQVSIVRMGASGIGRGLR